MQKVVKEGSFREVIQKPVESFRDVAKVKVESIEISETESKRKSLTEQLNRMQDWMHKAEKVMIHSGQAMVAGIIVAAIGGGENFLLGSQGAIGEGFNVAKNIGLAAFAAGTIVCGAATIFDWYMDRREKAIHEQLKK